ncbi:MAG: ParB/RepB/Spo0J family partition protein [Thermoanaerobaculia bacterium]|nr:MAG: ParB/RepB/Spo0J family partition protein [Thermoanaerobaculia bacterium]
MSEATAAKRGLPVRVKMRHTAHFVDEFAARHEAAVGRLLPLSSIQPQPGQPRRDMGDLAPLVASIREKGVLEPILVRRLATDPAGGEEGGGQRFSIVAGERRFRAALEAGLYEIPAIELEISEQEALEIALIENLQRRDLSPFEEAEGYRALGERHGYTQESIAKAVGKSRSLVAETLALLQIPERLRETAERLGIRSRSLLLEVAKLGDPAKMKALLERAGRQGLTRDDVRKDTREAARKPGAGGRRKPYVFKFKAPDQRYQLQLSFRQSTVDRTDLIHALEQILEELRTAKDE